MHQPLHYIFSAILKVTLKVLLRGQFLQLMKVKQRVHGHLGFEPEFELSADNRTSQGMHLIINRFLVMLFEETALWPINTGNTCFVQCPCHPKLTGHFVSRRSWEVLE